MLVVINVTSAVMMAAMMCVAAPGVEELNELGLRAGGAQYERAAFPDRGGHVAQRRQGPACKSRPRQPRGNSANSL